MKKLYILLAFLTISSVGFGQRYFNNNTGNNLWMDAGNWSQGNIGNGIGHKVVIKAGNPIIDGENIKVAQIKIGTAGTLADTTVITATNGGTLELTGEGVTAVVVNATTEAQGGKDIMFDLPVTLKSFQAFESVQILAANNAASGYAKVIFGSNGSLTLANNTDLKVVNVTGNKRVVFDNKLTGTNKLIIGATNQIVFGSSFDGSDHSGIIEVLGNNAKLTANVADDGTFVASGNKIYTEAASTGVEVTLNGANIYKGDIETRDGALKYKVNKNQSGIGTVTLGAGNLDLVIDDAVTSVAFADNSASTWGSNVVVTGFKDNVISFGTSGSGLTVSQIAQVTIDNSGTLRIDDSGKLTTEVEVVNTSLDSLDLFFSEYAEGSSNNKYLEIYNPTCATISLEGYAYPSTSNAPTVAGEYEFWNAFDEGASISPGGVYIIAHPSADESILALADETHQYLSNGDDGYALVKGTEESYEIVDWIGNWDADPGSGWDVAGVAAATKDHTLVRKATVTTGNTNWTNSAGTSAEDSEWIVYDQNTWDYLGSHDYSDIRTLLFSEYAEGSSNNKYLEIYNPTCATISLEGYAYPSTSNAPTVAGEYEFWNAFDEGASISPGGVYIIAHPSADESILALADETHQYLSNGDDGYALVKGTEESYEIVDWIGNWDADPGSGWDVAGVAAATKDHTLVRKETVISGNTDWTASAGTSAEDSEWIVYDQNTWDYLGSHVEIALDPSGTIVDLLSSNTRLFEQDTTLYLSVSITHPSSTNATTVDVVLTSGDASDIGDYTTQTLTFEAGSSDSDSVAITITNDELTEYKEDFVFELQNVTGGESAYIGSNSIVTISLDNDDYESTALILNEFLSDPAADDENTSEIEGDANGDGVRDGSQDEFIELINSGSESMDLSGYEIHDRTGLRHTFADGSLLPAGMPYVVFGGGLPVNIDNPLVDTASTGYIGLNNGGDLIVVKDKSGVEVIIFEYGSLSHGGANDLRGDQDQSVTRDPDITGNFVLHSTTAGGLAFSPGLKNDNVSFDADGDGVADDYDNCPDTPEGESVDENGCADSQKDTDGDGVTDDIDECANTPSGALVDDKGCELPLFVEKVSFVNRIYPNPASEILKVELDNSSVLNKYLINDLNGKVIEATIVGQKLRYLEIDIKSFNSGLYILNLEFEKGNSKVKFLKE